MTRYSAFQKVIIKNTVLICNRPTRWRMVHPASGFFRQRRIAGHGGLKRETEWRQHKNVDENCFHFSYNMEMRKDRIFVICIASIIFLKAMHCVVCESAFGDRLGQRSSAISVTGCLVQYDLPSESECCDSGCLCKGAVFQKSLVELSKPNLEKAYFHCLLAAQKISRCIQPSCNRIPHELGRPPVVGRALRHLNCSLIL